MIYFLFFCRLKKNCLHQILALTKKKLVHKWNANKIPGTYPNRQNIEVAIIVLIADATNVFQSVKSFQPKYISARIASWLQGSNWKTECFLPLMNSVNESNNIERGGNRRDKVILEIISKIIKLSIIIIEIKYELQSVDCLTVSMS